MDELFKNNSDLGTRQSRKKVTTLFHVRFRGQFHPSEDQSGKIKIRKCANCHTFLFYFDGFPLQSLQIDQIRWHARRTFTSEIYYVDWVLHCDGDQQ